MGLQGSVSFYHTPNICPKLKEKGVQEGGRRQGAGKGIKCKRESALMLPDFQRARARAAVGQTAPGFSGIPALVNHKGLLAVRDGFFLCLLSSLPHVGAWPLSLIHI